MTHDTEMIANESARTPTAETWTADLAVLMREIDLYLTFWGDARSAPPDPPEKESR